MPTVKLTYYLLSNQLIDSVDETSNSSTSIATTTTPKNVQAAAEMNWVWVARASPSQSHIWVCARALLLFGPRFCAPFWAETHQLNFSTASILFAKKIEGCSSPLCMLYILQKKQTYRNRISLSEIIFFEHSE